MSSPPKTFTFNFRSDGLYPAVQSKVKSPEVEQKGTSHHPTIDEELSRLSPILDTLVRVPTVQQHEISAPKIRKVFDDISEEMISVGADSLDFSLLKRIDGMYHDQPLDNGVKLVAGGIVNIVRKFMKFSSDKAVLRLLPSILCHFNSINFCAKKNY